jgi:hypothetical protein
MLRIGQKRPIEQTALAAEPGCAADSNSAELGSKYRPDQRTLCTSFGLTQPPRTGWPMLRSPFTHRSAVPRSGRRSFVQSDNSAWEVHPLLLNSMQGIVRSQHGEESLLLRRKIEELNRNTVLLIAEAGRLIQGSKQLSDRLKSFENPAPKRESASRFH